MRKYVIVFMFYVSWIAGYHLLLAQDTGTPFITNYSPKEYNGHSQNWAVVQDTLGIMYFANNNGILSYDGVRWKLIETGSIVRSMGRDAEGRIYVGTHGNFGYLNLDEKGALYFESLLDFVPEEFREFTDVWKTLTTPDGVFFQTSGGIYKWEDKTITYVPSEKKIHISFWVEGQLFVKILRDGMMILQNGELIDAPNFDFFKEIIPFAMLPYNENEVLLGTYGLGLKTYNIKTGEVKDFPSEANEFLSENGLYHGIEVPGDDVGNYAFATLGNGIVVIDRTGKILNKVTLEQGLQNNRVKYVYSDNQRNLWLALNNGISKVEVNSPIKYFGASVGIKGKVYAVTRYNDQLLLGNPDGVFSWNQESFTPYNGPAMQIWDWIDYKYDGKSVLLMGTERGVFEYDPMIPKSLLLKRHAFTLEQSRFDSSRVFVGFEDGFALLEYKENAWQDPIQIPGIQSEIRSIVEDDEANIWLGTSYSGIIRVQLDERIKAPTVIKYDTLHGLNNLSTPEPAIIGDSLIFFTASGIMGFDPSKNMFVESDWLGIGNAETEQSINYYGQDATGKHWTRIVEASNNKSFLILDINEKGEVKRDSLPFMRLPEMEVINVYHDRDSVSWIGSSEGLYKYNSKDDKQYQKDFKTVISQVDINGDSIIYYGSRNPKGNRDVKIEFSRNPMRFQFSALSYENEYANQFSYFLEGSDDQWSPWTKEAKVRYTNLWEGDYTFRVRSKNVYGIEGEEAVYSFTITPPLHRSKWAYALYILFIIVGMWGIIRFNVIRLKRYNERLEKIVDDRVEEIWNQKKEIETQASNLKKANDKITQQNSELEKYLREITIKNEDLKAYDQMVSHDLKGPIGSVYGLANLLKQDGGELKSESKEILENIISSSKNSIDLIDGILSFASADSPDEIEEEVDLNKQVARAIEGHSFSIKEKGATVNVEDLPCVGRGVSVKVYQLFYNLIGNALKFQAEGNPPIVSIFAANDEIVVEDNGIGFDSKYAEDIFKPLNRLNHSYEGHGIGLGTCQRIVDFHGWKIRAESEVGKGSKFIITV